MAPIKGVRPWQGGTYLTSVGLNDLDAILGGGQPLGTCIVVEEDRWVEDLALSLVRYWCAEVRGRFMAGNRTNADTSVEFTVILHCMYCDDVLTFVFRAERLMKMHDECCSASHLCRPFPRINI
jgi:hypothetical protein